MRVIDRFRGAWLGTAIAESNNTQPSHSFLAILQTQAQQIQSLRVFDNVESLQGEDLIPSEVAGISLSLLATLMLHDSDTARRQYLKHSSQPLDSSVVLLLSELISAQLKNQTIGVFAEPLKSAEAQAIWASIQGLIEQQLPLQNAVKVLVDLPDLEEWEIAIALSIYVWSCTPQNFSISVPRSQIGLKYLQQSCSQAIEQCQFIPALTGFLTGLTMGVEQLSIGSLPVDISRTTQHAEQLFNLWAGINNRSQSKKGENEPIIMSPGTLKPRPSSPTSS